jgi:hypothetical protein
MNPLPRVDSHFYRSNYYARCARVLPAMAERTILQLITRTREGLRQSTSQFEQFPDDPRPW